MPRIHRIDEENTGFVREIAGQLQNRFRTACAQFGLDPYEPDRPVEAFAIRSVRGYALLNPDASTNVIAVPVWAIKEEAYRERYATYYVAHELAHLYSDDETHGKLFMSWLKALCPTELQKYEYEYNPRNSKKFGLAV